jgi:hypothetical protein
MKVYLGMDTDELCADILHATLAPAYRPLADPAGGLDDTGPGLALGATGVTPGTYGDATHVAQVTVGADGRLTAVVGVAISGGGGGPGGSSGDVQVNDGSGGFAGSPDLHWTAATSLAVTDGTRFFVAYVSGQVQVYDGTRSAQLLGATAVFSGSDGVGGTVAILNGTWAFDATSGSMHTLGQTNNTYSFQNNTTPPTPQGLFALPLSVYGSGAIANLLGDPDEWLLVERNGTVVKIPVYY